MNKVQFIEKLKQNMPEGLNEIETAKYIYVELGKEKAFDEKYFFGNSKTRRQIYKLAEQTKHNTDTVAKNKKIICVSLTYLYRDILKEFGINSVVAEDGNHKYPIILLNDKMQMIKADLQLDLYNIQTKSKTQYFATRSRYESYDVIPIDEKYLREIDEKIGYIQKNENYRDYEIEKIKEEVKYKNANEALSIILNNNQINDIDEEIGSVERSKYYGSILRQTVSNYIDRKIFSFNCYRKNVDGEKDYTTCIYSREKETIQIYLYSNKQKRFANIGISKLGELIDQGLHLGIRGREQGVRQLQKIVKQEKEKSEKMFE